MLPLSQSIKSLRPCCGFDSQHSVPESRSVVPKAVEGGHGDRCSSSSMPSSCTGRHCLSMMQPHRLLWSRCCTGLCIALHTSEAHSSNLRFAPLRSEDETTCNDSLTNTHFTYRVDPGLQPSRHTVRDSAVHHKGLPQKEVSQSLVRHCRLCALRLLQPALRAQQAQNAALHSACSSPAGPSKAWPAQQRAFSRSLRLRTATQQELVAAAPANKRKWGMASKLKDLREELERRGVNSNGKKVVLLEKLRKDDERTASGVNPACCLGRDA